MGSRDRKYSNDNQSKGLDSETEPNSRQYVLLLSRTSASMRITYFMVDPRTSLLLPVPSHVKWPKLMDLIEYRACVLKNCLYILGGREKSTGKVMRDVTKYDLTTGRWRECCRMKKARHAFSAVAFNNRIYIIGGESSSGELLDSCESYEPLTDDWHREEKLPGLRAHHVCVVNDRMIYLSGGVSKAEPYSDHVWLYREYHPDRRQADKTAFDWFPLKSDQQKTMSHRRAKHCAVQVKNKLYFIGGLTKADQDTSGTTKKKKKQAVKSCTGLEAYDMGGSSGSGYTTSLPSLSTREKVASWNTNTHNKPQVLVVNPTAPSQLPSRWSKDLPPQPDPRCCAGVVSIGHRIYVVGGHSAESPDESINSVAVYHTRRRQWRTAFPLDGADYSDLQCVKVSVPLSNTDFKPVSYGDCKWVMW